MSISFDSLQNQLSQYSSNQLSMNTTSSGSKAGSVSSIDSSLGGLGSSQAGSSFSDVLNAALDQTSAAQNTAQAESLNLLTGQADSVHSVVLAAEKADLSLRLTLQVRNKVLDAYNEIMRMQI